jgi:hypothetical protein
MWYTAWTAQGPSTKPSLQCKEAAVNHTCRCLQVAGDASSKLPGYYRALYILLQSLVDPDAAWRAGTALTGFNFTAFALTRTSMLYFIASKEYTDIPDAPPAPSQPASQPQTPSSASTGYNASAVALVPSA